jgi:hypothetical protein
MAKLSLLIGSLLRDLAQSRVISDTYSRDVSVDYQDDPILRLFPVPRMEIKEVSISIPISVKSVQPGVVKTDQIVKSIAKQSAEKLRSKVMEAVTAKVRNKETLVKAFAEEQVEKRIENAVEQKLSQSASQISKATEGEATDLSSAICELVQRELLVGSKIAKELRLDTDNAPLKTVILRTCDFFVKNVFTKDLREAIDAAQEKASVIDVGVTAEELAGIPETAVTRITLVTDVRNYQWMKSEEADGKTVRQLVLQ